MSYLTQNENRLGLLVFLLSFLVYVLTLCPTVFTGDSGELIVDAYTLSVPHPPGYPLFCLAGKLFTFIPIGSIACRVNLMCAFFASLTATIVYFIIIQIIKSISPDTILLNKFLPALSASLIFAYSNTFWAQAVAAEVYILSAFMLALVLLILIKWIQAKENKFLYWFSFLYGVAITCHHLGLFFAPGFFLVILLYEPKVFIKPKIILTMFSLFILGLCLYLYIPIRSFSNPAINWNKVHDIESFIGYLLRRQYGEPKENYNAGYFLINFTTPGRPGLKSFLSFINKEFSLIWVVSAFGLLVFSWRAKRYLLVFLSIFFIAGFRVWSMAGIPISDQNLYIGKPYVLPTYIIIAIFIGIGFFYLIEISFKHTRRFFYYLAVLVVSLVIVTPLLSNYAENDQSRNYIAYDYGRNVLDTLDKDAILLGEGDNTLFILAYLTLAEKLRPDVTVYDDIGGDVFKDTPFAMFSLDNEGKDKVISELLRKYKRPVYVSFGNTLLMATSHRKELVGIVYKILNENEKVDPGLSQEYWQNYRLRDVFGGRLENKDLLMRELLSGYHVALGTYFLSKRNEYLGVELLRRAAEIAKDSKFIQQALAMSYSLRGMHKEAIVAMKKALESEPFNPDVHSNLGVTYAKARMYAEAITAWRRALELNPNQENAAKFIEKAKDLLLKNTASKKHPVAATRATSNRRKPSPPKGKK